MSHKGSKSISLVKNEKLRLIWQMFQLHSRVTIQSHSSHAAIPATQNKHQKSIKLEAFPAAAAESRQFLALSVCSVEKRNFWLPFLQ